MRKVILISILILLYGTMGLAEGSSPTEVSTVYIIPISGTVDHGMAAMVKRVVNGVKPQDVIILSIDTFGGLVDAATIIKDSLVKAPVETIAFVEKRAWSAGALITIACKKIVMAPGSSLGAAEPRPADEKTISALKGEFESTAEARGRDPKIAGAMVDKNISIENLVNSGELLTLTADKAKEVGYADFFLSTQDELFNELGLKGAKIIEVKLNWAEYITRWLTEPTILSMLLTFGFLGIFFELQTPGWGIPGTFGAISLVLYFGGRYMAGLAGWEYMLLILAGLGLIFIEMHTPGFGVAGITGISAVAIGMFLSLGGLENIVPSLIGATVAILVVVITLVIYLPRSRVWKSLGLQKEEKVEEGYIAPRDYESLLGKKGVAITMLRPTGIALIEGARINVQTNGEFLPPNTPVEIIQVEGVKIIVTKNTKT